MTITVEDGSNVLNANSYVSVEDADTYHSNRGNDAWTDADDLDKDSALQRATKFIDARYRTRWVGYRTHGRAQALEWPRTNAHDLEGNLIDLDEIPVEVKDALCEAALREVTSKGSLLPDYVTSDRVIEQTVGPISTVYAPGGSPVPVVPILDEILGPVLKDQGNVHTAFLRRA